MSLLKTAATPLAALLLLSGCVSQPVGPTVQVMPAPGKPFDVFQQDQAICEHYASQQTAGEAQAASNRQILTGVAGTALGAALGGAIGGGRGAGIGAASGAVAGSVVGAGGAQQAQMSLQQRYNLAYAQCMYAHGNQVPGYQPSSAPPPPPPPPTQPYR